jgi:Flp pilus assembly protein protease CpaA
MFFCIIGLLICSFWDIKTHRIPNKVTCPCFLLGLTEFLIYSLVFNKIYIFANAFLCSLFTFILYYILYRLKVLGAGDVKLSALCGMIMPSILLCFIAVLFQLFLSGVFSFLFIKKSEKIPIALPISVATVIVRFLV